VAERDLVLLNLDFMTIELVSRMQCWFYGLMCRKDFIAWSSTS
jgi:hypothetical protein